MSSDKAADESLLSVVARTDKEWSEMSHEERMTFLIGVVSGCESQDELAELLNEIGVGPCTIIWQDLPPNDAIAKGVREDAREKGFLVSRTDALVRIITPDERF